jgi:phosphatidate cytidylyltransferase
MGFFMPLFVALYLFLLLGLICSNFPPEGEAAPFLEKQFHETVLQAFGLIYIVGFLSYVPAIHSLPDGGAWLLLLLLIIWGGDSVAYFVGRKFGKNKLSAVISPGKSWEGAIAALFWSLLVGLIFAAISNAGWQAAIILPLTAVLCSAAGQAGDLIESWIKRTVYAKDSGSIMPGHGGMFDRFDSLIFAAPVYFYLLQFFVVK